MNELILALLTIIPMLEGDSNGNPKEGAVGPYHIRQIYLDDTNRIIGLTGDLAYTLDDITPKRLSKQIVYQYLTYYGMRYTITTGKWPTIEVLARIHNGGPMGWCMRATEDYGQRAKNLWEGMMKDE